VPAYFDIPEQRFAYGKRTSISQNLVKGKLASARSCSLKRANEYHRIVLHTPLLPPSVGQVVSVPRVRNSDLARSDPSDVLVSGIGRAATAGLVDEAIARLCAVHFGHVKMFDWKNHYNLSSSAPR